MKLKDWIATLDNVLSLPLSVACIYASHFIFSQSSEDVLLFLTSLSCLTAGLIFLNRFIEYFLSRRIVDFISKKRR